MLPRSSETPLAQGAKDSGYSDVRGAEICAFRALQSVSVECEAALLERAMRAPCPRRIRRPGPLRCIFSLLCTETHAHASKHGRHTGRCAHMGDPTRRPRHTHSCTHTYMSTHTAPGSHTQLPPRMTGPPPQAQRCTVTPAGAIPTEHRLPPGLWDAETLRPGAPFPNVTTKSNFSHRHPAWHFPCRVAESAYVSQS